MTPDGLAVATITRDGVIRSFKIRENGHGRFVDIDPCGRHISCFMAPSDVDLFTEHLAHTLDTGKEMQNTHMVYFAGQIDYRFAHIRRITSSLAKVFLTCGLPDRRKPNKDFT